MFILTGDFQQTVDLISYQAKYFSGDNFNQFVSYNNQVQQDALEPEEQEEVANPDLYAY